MSFVTKRVGMCSLELSSACSFATCFASAAGPVIANPEEAERAMRQVQQLQAGGALEAWEEVPMIVGDVPKTGRQTTDSQDLSPPRRGRHDSPDVSPQRKRGPQASAQQRARQCRYQPST